VTFNHRVVGSIPTRVTTISPEIASHDPSLQKNR
jgi:hypothetical protein